MQCTRLVTFTSVDAIYLFPQILDKINFNHGPNSPSSRSTPLAAETTVYIYNSGTPQVRSAFAASPQPFIATPWAFCWSLTSPTNGRSSRYRTGSNNSSVTPTVTIQTLYSAATSVTWSAAEWSASSAPDSLPNATG